MVFRSVCRRKSDPRAVQKLWAAITYIRSQKQVANLDRISRYVQREYEMKASEADEQLQLAIDDGLIEAYSAVSTKGSNVGQEQDGFRISSEDEEGARGTHDWYCYECHKPGEVLECSECWRVFHAACTDIDADDSLESSELFVCTVCKDVKKQARMKRKELNRLLGFTIIRLKDKSQELHWFGGRDLGLDRFVYNYMDLNMMEDNAAKRRYKYLEQFYSDAHCILHNIFICYGETGIIPELARVMMRDCRYDLDEIRQCKYCYHHSNARTQDWFAQPCRPPHELVFAKQKGFSYWPAKVIKISAEGHDVRFFGALHQRAIIATSAIKPIDTPAKALSLKKTVGFVKAMKELERHRELLARFASKTHGDNDDSTGDNDLDDDMDKDDEDDDDDKDDKKKKKKHNGDKNDDDEDEEEDDDDKDDDSPAKKKKKKHSPSSASLSRGTGGDKKPQKGEVEKKRKEAPGSLGSRVRHRSKDHKRHRRSSMEELAPVSSTGKPPASGRHRAVRTSAEPVTSDGGGFEDSSLVSSSEDKIHGAARVVSMSDIGIQTSKKLSQLPATNGRRSQKSTQTDFETSDVANKDGKNKGGGWVELETLKGDGEQPGASGESSGGPPGSTTTCNCESKYTRIFEETRLRLEREAKEEKEKALQELEERLRGEFDEDRQKAVRRAVANVRGEAENARHVAEEKSKEEANEEIKKLTTKHKAEISLAKKKQWCYNCEEEAMYHCCWNTSYCSIKCQQEHWHTEHKRMCRRKRN